MIRLFKRIRLIFNIKKFLPFLFEFFVSKKVSLSKKAVSILFIVGYFWLPFDIIPDFLAVLGILDDVTILMLVLQQIIKLAPIELREKHGLLED
ncbi:DUF1232 domain-containing protein [Bacillus tianshenii]|nr:DUF1232 domain-containing protein [Bacillus tianshenii]